MAVDAHRAALEEYTRERVPLNWAGALNNLGAALSTLGERESGTASLEAAVDVYRAALEECTRERVPLQWATTQNNLRETLQALGKWERSVDLVKQAIKAYRDALDAFQTGDATYYMTYVERKLTGANSLLKDVLNED